MVRLKVKGMFEQLIAICSFNSNMVRLKGMMVASSFIDLWRFQFQYGSIKRWFWI